MTFFPPFRRSVKPALPTFSHLGIPLIRRAYGPISRQTLVAGFPPACRATDRWYERWFVAWADLVDGLAGVLSLGRLRPDCGSEARLWVLRRRLGRRIQLHDEVERQLGSMDRPPTNPVAPPPGGTDATR